MLSLKNNAQIYKISTGRWYPVWMVLIEYQYENLLFTEEGE